MSIRFSIAVMAIATLAGCVSYPLPTEQFKLTEQALEQAKAVGAGDDQPEMEVALARFAEARASMATHAYKDARMKAEQAELDARLAEARVLTLKSQEQVNQLNTRLNRLRKQLGEAQ
ncbi:putative lipoprotein [Pseudomonas savastanoi pv. glycinea]|nr:putative lipoprotein [Pseudomonas savastanoi pv. glycinea]